MAQNGEVQIVSPGPVAEDASFYMDPSRTSYGRTSASVDPIEVALAIRSVRISVDAMQAQFFNNSFLNSLA